MMTRKRCIKSWEARLRRELTKHEEKRGKLPAAFRKIVLDGIKSTARWRCSDPYEP